MIDPGLTLPSSIVFDLDGTLVDTAPDLCAALNYVLEEEDRPPVAPDDLRHMVGHGARVLIIKSMAATGAPATADDLDRLLPIFLEYYGAHVADRSVPFEGVPALLEILRDRGSRLAVCTNKPEALAVQLLDGLNLSRHFGAILGGDSLAVRKPDPEPLFESIRRLGDTADKALMVGDSRTDVETARAAQIPVICVSFGYTDCPVEDLNPDAIIDHFNEFGDAVARLRTV